MISLLIGLAISMAVALFGYSRARAFVSERLSPLEGVLSTSTHFMLKTYKRFGVLMHSEHEDERLSVAP